MKKVIMFLLMIFSLYAGEDYSEMSTQELLAIMGYVSEPKEQSKLLKELKIREGEMSVKEKKEYKKNLKKIKK